MTDIKKSDLVGRRTRTQPHIDPRDTDLAAKAILEHMNHVLAAGERVKIRGFGSLTLYYRPPRMGRNPKNSKQVSFPGRHVPHFNPGKELRERVNAGRSG